MASQGKHEAEKLNEKLFWSPTLEFLVVPDAKCRSPAEFEFVLF